MVLIFFAPGSPWWLTRKDRTDEALRSLQRLGNSSENHREKLAMIERTVEIEAKLGEHLLFWIYFAVPMQGEQ
jgi:SP family general alpha glucoside:H+ symporter-like MFS transporter